MRPVVRALVWVWAIVALAFALQYGVHYALSIPPPEGYDELAWEREPGRPRLVLAPLVDVSVAEPGQRVVWRTEDGNATFVSEVVFLVERNASGAYDVPALGVQNVTAVEVANRTWPLPETLGPGPGLYVAMGDRTPHAEGEPLLGADRVDGVVARHVDASELLLSVGLASAGALVPIVILIVTQRPRRAPDGAQVWDPALSPAAPSAPCTDCGRPVSPGATFCLACGAYLRRPPPEGPSP